MVIATGDVRPGPVSCIARREGMILRPLQLRKGNHETIQNPKWNGIDVFFDKRNLQFFGSCSFISNLLCAFLYQERFIILQPWKKTRLVEHLAS
jgi:hypothetical protein